MPAMTLCQQFVRHLISDERRMGAGTENGVRVQEKHALFGGLENA
jgi:hypothetical protein